MHLLSMIFPQTERLYISEDLVFPDDRDKNPSSSETSTTTARENLPERIVDFRRQKAELYANSGRLLLTNRCEKLFPNLECLRFYDQL